MIPPLLDGKALEQYEAFTVEEFVAHGVEKLGEARKLEVVLTLCQLSSPTCVSRRATFDMPVKGKPAILKLSAASLISAISSSVNQCVHRSGLTL